jgi:putative nucleotidyltransferase with HDIG domain
VGTGAVLSALLTIQLLPDRVSLRVNQIAPEDVIAPRYLQYLDERATERLRAQAQAQVPRQYKSDHSAPAEAEREVRRFYETVRRVQRDAPAVRRDRLQRELADELGSVFSHDRIATALKLSTGVLTRLEQQTVAVVARAMAEPIRNDTDDMSRVRSQIGDRVAALSLPNEQAALVVEVASVALRPNHIFAAAATADARRREADLVEPVYRVISRGNLIIRRNERVTQEHIERLSALGLRSPQIDFRTAFHLALACYGLVALVGIYLYHFQRPVYRDPSRMLLLAVIAVVSLLIFRVGGTMLGLKLSGAQLGYLGMICATTASMLAAVLLNPAVGLFLAPLLSFLVGLLVQQDLLVSVIALVSALVGVHVVSNIRDRAGLVRAGALVSAANLLTIGLVHGLGSGEPRADLMTGLAWGLVGGLVSALLFAAFATILERPFGVTTHLTLLELSDPNKPLLKRLAMEAPGTYAHSIVVGNLAEAAAEAIGADPLYARVSSYYHDIGKVFRPQFFIENQQRENLHDRMSPSLSRLVVTSHVRDGVALALRHRLPPPVIDIIREHHGTCLIRYFYHQAMTSGEPDAPALEYQFRYEGPRPRTRESGIIMLADAAEAASRPLEKPTPGRIRDLIERIVRDRLADGQLDDCELTFKDLEKVIASFTRSLTGMLHARIEYPHVLTSQGRKLVSNGAAVTEPVTVPAAAADLPVPHAAPD